MFGCLGGVCRVRARITFLCHWRTLRGSDILRRRKEEEHSDAPPALCVEEDRGHFSEGNMSRSSRPLRVAARVKLKTHVYSIFSLSPVTLTAQSFITVQIGNTQCETVVESFT